jgi:16S rRNA pseudouridine516 synthase
MFAAVGNHVEALHRDRIGALSLPADLGPGEYRQMSPADVAAVFK